MQQMPLLLSAAAALLLSACSQTNEPMVGEPADAPAVETPMERAADMPAGTTIKADDGSKIKKQEDGDIKVKDAAGNKVKMDADDGTVKVK